MFLTKIVQNVQPRTICMNRQHFNVDSTWKHLYNNYKDYINNSFLICTGKPFLPGGPVAPWNIKKETKDKKWNQNNNNNNNEAITTEGKKRPNKNVNMLKIYKTAFICKTEKSKSEISGKLKTNKQTKNGRKDGHKKNEYIFWRPTTNN